VDGCSSRKVENLILLICGLNLQFLGYEFCTILVVIFYGDR
jgi:hypothetical protein